MLSRVIEGPPVIEKALVVAELDHDEVDDAVPEADPRGVGLHVADDVRGLHLGHPVDLDSFWLANGRN